MLEKMDEQPNEWDQYDVKSGEKTEKIDGIDLHSFGDASNNGVSAVVHAVVHKKN